MLKRVTPQALIVALLLTLAVPAAFAADGSSTRQQAVRSTQVAADGPFGVVSARLQFAWRMLSSLRLVSLPGSDVIPGENSTNGVIDVPDPTSNKEDEDENEEDPNARDQENTDANGQQQPMGIHV